MIWEPHDPASYLIHIALGSVALVAGIVALASKKGASTHLKSGKVFTYLMIPVAISVIIFMTQKFLPLALVMSLSVLYAIPSAINAFRSTRSAVWWDRFLIVIPLLVCIFAAIQFVRTLTIPSAPTIGPFMMAATFGFLVFQDIGFLRNRSRDHFYQVRRHLTRMVLAFTFAAMSILREGIDLGLSFEQTVIYPLLVGWLCIAYCFKKYSQEKPVPAQA